MKWEQGLGKIKEGIRRKKISEVVREKSKRVENDDGGFWNSETRINFDFASRNKNTAGRLELRNRIGRAVGGRGEQYVVEAGGGENYDRDKWGMEGRERICGDC